MPPAEYAASAVTTRCRIFDWWSNGRKIRLKPHVLACFPPHTYYETCPIAPDGQWAPVGRPTGRSAAAGCDHVCEMDAHISCQLVSVISRRDLRQFRSNLDGPDIFRCLSMNRPRFRRKRTDLCVVNSHFKLIGHRPDHAPIVRSLDAIPYAPFRTPERSSRKLRRTISTSYSAMARDLALDA